MIYVPFPVKYNISLVFCIIDAWRIQSEPTGEPTGSTFAWCFYFIQSKIYLQVFKVVVEHFKIITLNFIGHGHMTSKVFDGPGVKYPLIGACHLQKPLLQGHNVKCSETQPALKLRKLDTSSFQCVIHHFKMHNSMEMTYSSHSVEIQKMLEPLYTNTTITYPFDLCKNREVCVWYFCTERNSLLTFAVEAMENFGYDNPSCNYGGFSVYDKQDSLVVKQCVIKRYEAMRSMRGTGISIQRGILGT